ncbi:Holliday junction branch migration protein RuvA [Acetanaerobacterium elongatum]|uniref:Holliday junction branch migration complex subunit RuvA n=1 Tax=Acetanaerobacterium elongatum TaxID=258515 RepID=A0A1G9V9A9_9FIRM|nr:Holliday junction branch migration protein RuvA [Acetanaerobacterium elongatum]SDM68656.1 Holliday junction DNA helicase subunit RuvA [Acetanaerobacterium elongatum]
MLYSVRGKLIHKEPYLAVVECGGVGFKCITTTNTLAKLGETGSEVTLYTYLHVREDVLDLFGFAEMGELNCFKMLLSVSGVGPKVALAILSDLTPERFALCVAANDTKTITKAQGVGAKLAQRIVLELKDKLKTADMPTTLSGEAFSGVSAAIGGNAGEAVSALVVLGYSQADAAKAVSGLSPELPSAELIRQALKYLSAHM